MSASVREFFVMTNSNAAPFFSDTGERYVAARDAQDALAQTINTYGHPAGLYSVAVYESADAYHRHAAALATWKSERAYKADPR